MIQFRKKIRPAAKAAISGRSGEIPLGDQVGVNKWSTPAPLGRNSKVVLPAPFGPAMMMHRIALPDGLLISCGER
jgi:hypothetical protein